MFDKKLSVKIFKNHEFLSLILQWSRCTKYNKCQWLHCSGWATNLFSISVTFYKNDNIHSMPLLFSLQAFDADTGKDSILIYQLLSYNDMFLINQTTGWITTKQLLAGQKGLLFEFNVEVADNGKRGDYSTDATVVRVRSSKRSYYGDYAAWLWFWVFEIYACSCLQMFYKIGVVTYFAKFNGIHLLLSLFSNTGVFLRILQKF